MLVAGNDSSPTSGQIYRITNADILGATALTSPYAKSPVNVKEESMLGNAGSPDFLENLAWLAINVTLSDTSDGPNGSNDVLAGDWLLVSPGSDGVYLRVGTLGSSATPQFDIQDANELDEFDDIWLSAGR